MHLSSLKSNINQIQVKKWFTELET